MSVFIKLIRASRVSKMLSNTGIMTSTSDGGQTSQMAKASVIWGITYQDREKIQPNVSLEHTSGPLTSCTRNVRKHGILSVYLETRTSHNRLRPEKLTGVS